MVSNTGKKVSMQGKFVSIALQTVKLNLQGDRQELDRFETARTPRMVGQRDERPPVISLDIRYHFSGIGTDGGRTLHVCLQSGSSKSKSCDNCSVTFSCSFQHT